MSTRAEQFLEVYSTERVENQRTYYERTATRFESRRQQVLLASSVVFGVSAAVGLIAGLDVRGKLVWAALAAILPAVTTALAAYDGLYAFERITKLNRDAARNLKRIAVPELEDAGGKQAAVARYVAEVEQVFVHERGQWGQLQAEAPTETRKSPRAGG
jgi:SMODS and SLOG-associating 2TM effector domain 1